MSKIDLSKYEGMSSPDSSLLIKILKENNLGVSDVLLDDIEENRYNRTMKNAKINPENINVKNINLYSRDLRWILCANKVENGVFYTDERPLIIYKG